MKCFNCGCPKHGPQSKGGCTKETEVGASLCASCKKDCGVCPHDREDITWDDKPGAEGFSNGNLDWFGTCVCGQRVTEQFTSQGYGTVSEDGDYSFIGS